jgi:hypothetical protein
MMPIALDVAGAVEAQRSWRAGRGLTPKVFPIQALLELLIDDIRAMRKQGRSDAQICRIVQQATARRIRPQDIQAVCAQEDICRAPGGAFRLKA